MLDTGRRELSRGGKPIELGRLTYALLLALVECAPNVLDHDQIVARVWGGRSTSPETVTQRVKLLRDAIGDNAENPRYIGLARGQGYRLLPDCRRLPAAAGTVAEEKPPASRALPAPWARLGRGRRSALAAGTLLVLAVLVAVGIALQQVQGPAGDFGIAEPEPPMPRSIAVLPFVDLGDDAASLRFAAGFYQTLLSELAGIAQLTVISGATMERYADRSLALELIASELRVETIMDGSVQIDGNRVRVTASLVDPYTGRQLWARPYDRQIDDVFEIQTDIALGIADQMRARLSPEEMRRIESRPTNSAAAYGLYIDALVDTDRRRLPLEDDRSRRPLLDRAIQLDPDFAEAYLARAEIYTWAVAYSEAGSSAEEISRQADYTARALSDAARALEIDPLLPGPWIVRGILDLEFWRWEDAQVAFARALAAGPNDADSLLQAAFFETYSGRFGRALQLAQRRLALDPQSVESNNGLGYIAIVAGQPEIAIERYAEVADLAPGIWFYYSTVALAHMQRGDRMAAESALRIADQLRGPDDMGVFLANCAIVYRWLGMSDEAEGAFAEFVAWTQRNVVGEGDWVLAYLGIGDDAQALAALQRAVDKVEAHRSDSHQALILIAANSLGDPVLERAEFAALRARLLPTGSFETLRLQ